MALRMRNGDVRLVRHHHIVTVGVGLQRRFLSFLINSPFSWTIDAAPFLSDYDARP